MVDRLRSSLRQRRLGLGLSQDALASRVGVTPQALRAVEAGRAVPSTSVALRLARALECTVEALFELPDERAEVPVFAPSPLVANARVRLASIDGRIIARPLLGQRGILRALPRADGVAAGPDSVRLMVPRKRLEQRLGVAGCDPAMALLSEALSHSREQVELVIEESASRSALAALANREVHVAGCHLLDEATGTYNRGFVEQMVPFTCTLVAFAIWQQGLIVAPGNPHGIREATDLARPSLKIVNREPGAGSRQLLDAHLRRAGIPVSAVRGYADLAWGHLAVAEAVAEGRADAGIGVKAAALALALDFVPLAEERYDLVVPNDRLDHPSVQVLLDMLRQRSFRAEVEALGGYDVSQMGGVA